MKFMKKYVGIGLVALLFAIVLTSFSLACSCMMTGTPAEHLGVFDAVFEGEVTEIEHNTRGVTDFYEIEFKVSRAWKGVTHDEIEIETSDSSASCGFNFVEGKKYIVYANDEEGRLTVNICSRTALVDDAREDLDYLNTVATIDLESGEEEENEPSFFRRIINFFRNLFN